ncbi:MarR family winged helix-turn-helix transcriptional regulator [Arthrobacter sp. A2-55]|uniref:MarR family winged helix-turn-helix transcriptional regulator n=1 Tax=Arthrobacter sp. A2-55 TaxID=2897337 RepID=UPI0021CD295A|nr:MarR family transcriptional regulator [Arthrobacter sp. A2-55]MCU6482230.1 MarR family transcriptional regulator [Arthrobacter sp. A2-55]
MSIDLQELAGRYRDILRQAVYLTRSMDAEGELSTRHVSTLNMVSTGPMRVSAIASYAGVRVPSATEQVIKLEAAGLVERIPDATDARAVLVRLTPKGREALDSANGRRNATMAAALETLSPEERQIIAGAIPAIAKLNAAVAAQPATA